MTRGVAVQVCEEIHKKQLQKLPPAISHTEANTVSSQHGSFPQKLRPQEVTFILSRRSRSWSQHCSQLYPHFRWGWSFPEDAPPPSELAHRTPGATHSTCTTSKARRHHYHSHNKSLLRGLPAAHKLLFPFVPAPLSHPSDANLNSLTKSTQWGHLLTMPEDTPQSHIHSLSLTQALGPPEGFPTPNTGMDPPASSWATGQPQKHQDRQPCPLHSHWGWRQREHT